MAPLQRRRPQQAKSLEGKLWSRPPLNYFHLIALALRNSSPCGLNVQQIYSFTRYVPVQGSVKTGKGGAWALSLKPSNLSLLWGDALVSLSGFEKISIFPVLLSQALVVGCPEMCVYTSLVQENIHPTPFHI